MSEKQMRRRVVKALKPFDGMSVENIACPGTPDVESTLGWIELKQLPGWTRSGHLPAMPHYRKVQRIWLAKRWRAGGAAFFLLQIGKEWLLFDGAIASVLDRGQSKDLVRESAIQFWPEGLVESELIQCMMKARRSSAPRSPTT